VKVAYLVEDFPSGNIFVDLLKIIKGHPIFVPWIIQDRRREEDVAAMQGRLGVTDVTVLLVLIVVGGEVEQALSDERIFAIRVAHSFRFALRVLWFLLELCF
jgi:hypothetical protein